MLIDWFTIAAQILNFLILVGLMKYFLYKPIINAIEKRDKSIASDQADAKNKLDEAQKEKESFQQKNTQFDQHKAKLMDELKIETEKERQRLLEEAADAAKFLKTKFHDSLAQDEKNLLQSIRVRTQKEVFAISRKVLSDLAGTSLEGQMVEIFRQRLQHIEQKDRDLLVASFRTGTQPLKVRTAFELPPAEQTVVKGLIDNVFGPQAKVDFILAPDLIGGIEIEGNGQKLGWSIADYLSSVENSLSELLKDKSQSETP